MTTVRVDLGGFPRETWRIVADWYRWQGAHVLGMGKELGAAAIPMASPEYSFWLANPPERSGDDIIFDIGGIKYCIIKFDGGWRIDRSERNDRHMEIMLRDFSDVEKFMLCRMAEVALKGAYDESPYYQWYQEGVASGVELQPVDPNVEFSDVYLFVDHDRVPRGSARRIEAVSFSHPLTMSYEAVEALYRSKIPAEHFTVDVITV